MRDRRAIDNINPSLHCLQVITLEAAPDVFFPWAKKENTGKGDIGGSTDAAGGEMAETWRNADLSWWGFFPPGLGRRGSGRLHIGRKNQEVSGPRRLLVNSVGLPKNTKKLLSRPQNRGVGQKLLRSLLRASNLLS